MSDTVRFIHKNGKIIPIRAAQATNVARGAEAGLRVKKLHQAAKKHLAAQGHSYNVKPDKKLDALGLGLSVASGALAAATFASGTKGFLAGAVATHAIDAAGIAANAASVKGHGNVKDRVKQGAKQEARNFVLGNGVFFAGLVGMKKNRELIASGASKLVALGKKALARG